MKTDGVRLVKFTALNLRENYDDTFATLVWSVRMGYPRITVFLDNDKFSKGDVDYSKQIRAPFDYIKLNVFLTIVEKAIDGENDKEYGVKCLNNAYSNGERTNDIKLQATVYAGKDDKGIVYLKVVEAGKKEIKFYLTMDGKYIKLVKPDGQDMDDPAILSKRYAKEYIKAVKLLLADEFKALSKVSTINAPANKTKYAGNKKSESSNTSLDIDMILEDI